MTDIGMTVKQFKQHLRTQELWTAIQKAQHKGLRRIGSYTRGVVMKRMRRGRFMKVSEYPPDLKRLLTVGRDEQGRFTKGAHDVQPIPKLASDPRKNQGPMVYTGLLKRFIFFVVDPWKMSVVTGPALLSGMKKKRTPELLEQGGQRDEDVGEWGKIYINGKPVVRLVRARARTIRYRPRGFMFYGHNQAVDKLVPQVWEDSLR